VEVTSGDLGVVEDIGEISGEVTSGDLGVVEDIGEISGEVRSGDLGVVTLADTEKVVERFGPVDLVELSEVNLSK
jgi:hypothetical protein